MRLTSKGLGKRALPFLLSEADISSEADADSGADVLWLRGRIIAKKVNWDYRMRVEDDDIIGFVKLARDPLVIDYLARRSGFGLIGAVAAQAARNLVESLRRWRAGFAQGPAASASMEV